MSPSPTIDLEAALKIAESVDAATFEGQQRPVQPLSREAVDLWVAYAKVLARALLTTHEGATSGRAAI